MLASTINMPNLLLSKIPPREIVVIIPILSPTTLIKNQSIYGSGEEIEKIYFPAGGLISENIKLINGGYLEVLTTGYEGAIGISALWGNTASTYDVIVQTSGPAWWVEATVLRATFGTCPRLQNALMKYRDIRLTQLARSRLLYRSPDACPTMRAQNN